MLPARELRPRTVPVPVLVLAMQLLLSQARILLRGKLLFLYGCFILVPVVL